MAKLTAAQVHTLGPGRHSDGGTLTLLVARTGGRSWVQRTMIAGRRADIGIGSASVVTLKMARQRALENRQAIWSGIDPRDAKRRAKVLTFRQAAERMIEANRGSWRNARTAPDMVSQLERYVYPALASKRVDTIDRAAVLRVLVPVCTEKPETGRRVRRAVRMVFAWAMAHGHISENPAGEAIDAALPKARASAEHHKALPYDKVSAALAAVEASSAAPAVRWCLWLLVLTACRSGEVRGACWSEIDTAAATWTIPAARMKSGRPHTVPLTRAALAILAQARTLDDGSGLCFPSPANPGRPLSDTVLVRTLKRAGVEAVPHGFRASFRTWASEVAEAAYEVAEAALAHAVGGVTERSYARGELVTQRRELMTDWAAYVLTA